MKIFKKISVILVNIIILFFTLTCLFPVIWLFISSFKEKNEFFESPISLPKAIRLDNYVDILTKKELYVWMGNSIRTSVISVILIILIGFIIGYMLARYRFKGRNFLYAYFLIGMLIPVHALMVPMYVLFVKCHLNNQWFTLILPYVALSLPISIFLVESFARGVPPEIEEAASIDGSSFNHTLFFIVMPMFKPVLTTVGIIQFFYCWNEFMFSLILNNSTSLKTIPVGITLFQGQYTTDYPRMMTSMLISMLPAIVIYFSFSKQIMKGMVAGAVKG